MRDFIVFSAAFFGWACLNIGMFFIIFEGQRYGRKAFKFLMAGVACVIVMITAASTASACPMKPGPIPEPFEALADIAYPVQTDCSHVIHRQWYLIQVLPFLFDRYPSEGEVKIAEMKIYARTMKQLAKCQGAH